MIYIITFELQVAVHHGEGTDYQYNNGKYEFSTIEDAQDTFEQMIEDPEYFNMMRNF